MSVTEFINPNVLRDDMKLIGLNQLATIFFVAAVVAYAPAKSIDPDQSRSYCTVFLRLPDPLSNSRLERLRAERAQVQREIDRIRDILNRSDDFPRRRLPQIVGDDLPGKPAMPPYDQFEDLRVRLAQLEAQRSALDEEIRELESDPVPGPWSNPDPLPDRRWIDHKGIF